MHYEVLETSENLFVYARPATSVHVLICVSKCTVMCNKLVYSQICLSTCYTSRDVMFGTASTAMAVVLVFKQFFTKHTQTKIYKCVSE